MVWWELRDIKALIVLKGFNAGLVILASVVQYIFISYSHRHISDLIFGGDVHCQHCYTEAVANGMQIMLLRQGSIGLLNVEYPAGFPPAACSLFRQWPPTWSFPLPSTHGMRHRKISFHCSPNPFLMCKSASAIRG